MNKNGIYIGIALIIGLLAGYFIFGTNNASVQQEKQNHPQEEITKVMWTCSMHPQIMQEEPGDCPICGMDLIPAETSAEGLAADQFKMTENAMALANIQTTIVGENQSDSQNIITLSGKINENEEKNAIQASYFNGRIEKLSINYKGQEVKKGQKLATIYSPDLIAAQQELITASSLKESQPQLYRAVRNKLKLWKLSEKQIKAIESSSRIQEKFPVYATVSGTVAEVMSAEGDYIKQGQPILKVSNLTTVWAEFDGYENQISQLKKGQKITISTNAYPNKQIETTISFIDPILNTNSRTTTIRAVLNNKDQMFKPGMFVVGKVTRTETTTKNIIVPSSAVLWTGKRSVVYVKTDPNTPIFEMREVVLENTTGDTYTILNGLNNGDEIVTNGVFTVDAAAQLQGKKSMMNKKGEDIVKRHENHVDITVSKSFQQEFLPALVPYLKMKDALIQSDNKQVTVFAKTMLAILKKSNASDLGKMEKELFIKSWDMLENITKKEALEDQRAYFVTLNENIVKLISGFNNLETTFYIQKCPMANTNKGAVWISTEKEIRNPYFGEAMLTCGSVIDTIN
ncbi:efflux RND transporter periplasmic adaptor subunit [Aquimarina muelleri]|uniref:Membrane fusion protein, Cu(I)/Ag(I) efflux system n=1 Tax=Aquimarina muelleri TaxID=279356 RepID=A0A918JSJ9_9FLAO|nr:efflux RND transporter periplasmic adaptor subunit [Aquimarina muelleri]MCX2763455.1 efflux RND transporter periplasmic adaptor subunit [Aquimarina muelleri]GGX02583.1 hypothetical protein GCM10007384_00380 [Aquimarina muelleri]